MRQFVTLVDHLPSGCSYNGAVDLRFQVRAFNRDEFFRLLRNRDTTQREHQQCIRVSP